MKKDILVVDDDIDILKSIKNVCEHEGFTVTTAANGYECIDKIAKGFRGIILIDIMMPYMDGWQTIKNLVNNGLAENIAIIIMTAIGTADHKKMKGLEPYIYDYIAKPFNIHDLLRTIEKAQAQ
ncbi:MAG: response regulator [Candidatus Thermoplasmatota archaeon]